VFAQAPPRGKKIAIQDSNLSGEVAIPIPITKKRGVEKRSFNVRHGRKGRRIDMRGKSLEALVKEEKGGSLLPPT